MFGILDRYIGRVIFMSILLCELTLVGLAALIKYVEQLRAVGEGNYDMLNALYFVLLSMPKEAVLFFPLAALLGGLIGLGQLATSSELVVMQASGRSKISIVMAALKTAIPLMIMVGLMGEYVAPIAKRMADDIKAGALSEGRLTVSAYGVWARDGNNFVNINGVRNDGALTGITLYRFTPERKLIDVVQAQEGVFERHHWLLKQTQVTRFDDPAQTGTLAGLGFGGAGLPQRLIDEVMRRRPNSLSGIGFGLTETNGVGAAASGAPSSSRRYRMFTAPSGPMTAISAVGHA